ncbi:MAG: DUF3050 domain-containing protein, partial [Planctomycetota bacterium]
MTTTAHTAHAEVAGRKAALSDHAAYRTLHSLDGLRRFMEHHAICVLDFMSIVKSLQRELTSVGPVWLPPADDASRAEGWLLENAPDRSTKPQDLISGFVGRADRLTDLLDGFMPEIAWLPDEETLTYLHSTV